MKLKFTEAANILRNLYGALLSACEIRARRDATAFTYASQIALPGFEPALPSALIYSSSKSSGVPTHDTRTTLTQTGAQLFLGNS
jgi:hypothetical protein